MLRDGQGGSPCPSASLRRVGFGHRDSKWTVWNEPHVSTFRCHRLGHRQEHPESPCSSRYQDRIAGTLSPVAASMLALRGSHSARGMTSASICVRVKVMSASDCDDTCHASNDCAARPFKQRLELSVCPSLAVRALGTAARPCVHPTRWMVASACERARTVPLRVAEYVRARRSRNP